MLLPGQSNVITSQANKSGDFQKNYLVSPRAERLPLSFQVGCVIPSQIQREEWSKQNREIPGRFAPPCSGHDAAGRGHDRLSKESLPLFWYILLSLLPGPVVPSLSPGGSHSWGSRSARALRRGRDGDGLNPHLCVWSQYR